MIVPMSGTPNILILFVFLTPDTDACNQETLVESRNTAKLYNTALEAIKYKQPIVYIFEPKYVFKAINPSARGNVFEALHFHMENVLNYSDRCVNYSTTHGTLINVEYWREYCMPTIIM